LLTVSISLRAYRAKSLGGSKVPYRAFKRLEQSWKKEFIIAKLLTENVLGGVLLESGECWLLCVRVYVHLQQQQQQQQKALISHPRHHNHGRHLIHHRRHPPRFG
jgi:hypothetical protein